jgi:uncharacterized protein
MSFIALEEHVFSRKLQARVGGKRDLFPGFSDQLAEVGEQRLASMDAADIDIQVLSVPSHQIQEAEPSLSVELARDANDELAAVVVSKPDRFRAFATLPLSDVEASVAELRRSVLDLGFLGAMLWGQTNGHFLDEPRYEPLWTAVEELNVPVYLHPAEPPAAVSAAYRSGTEPWIGSALERGAWGWHAEMGMHVLRLAASGTLERHRGVQVIVGHMGEDLPFTLERANYSLERVRASIPTAARLPRTVMETVLDQVAITTSGYPYKAPFECALSVFGTDRILFSVDYPFSDNLEAANAITNASISDTDREKIASCNARRILNLSP